MDANTLTDNFLGEVLVIFRTGVAASGLDWSPFCLPPGDILLPLFLLRLGFLVVEDSESSSKVKVSTGSVAFLDFSVEDDVDIGVVIFSSNICSSKMSFVNFCVI